MPQNNPLLVEDFENSLKPDSVSIPGIPEPGESEWAIGLFLCSLASFNRTIVEVRRTISLEELVPYIQQPNSQAVLGFFSHLNDEQQNKLSKIARQICDRYKLSENWQLPVQVAALTHKLLIPSDPSIIIREPLEHSSLVDIMAYLDKEPSLTRFPVIYPVYKVSINQLHEFIDSHRDEIRLAMSDLPPKPKSTLAPHTLLWGQLAWLLRTETPQPSWGKVAERINYFTKQLKGHVTANLSPSHAQEMYNRYARQLQRLESP